MLRNQSTTPPTLGTFAAAANSTVIDLAGAEGYSCVLNIVDATPGAKSFVAANVAPATDTITITAHGMFTGLKVALAGTNLPTGLSATNYWAVRVDADTIKLATSQANAVAGTVVDITGAGTTADATLTAAALTGATVQVQVSNDNTNFAALASSSQNITAAGNLHLTDNRPFYRYVQFTFAITTGQLTPTFFFRTKQ